MMTIDEAKKRIKEIESERNKLANERDELQRMVRKDADEKEYEKRKSMLGKCYKALRRGEYYEDVLAFRVDDVSRIGNYVDCLCIVDPDKRHNFCLLDRRAIYPFCSDCNAMIVPKNCTKVIDRFKEISEEEFDVMCDDVFKKLREKENNNEN